MRATRPWLIYFMLFWAVVAIHGCKSAPPLVPEAQTPYLSVWALLNPEVFKTAGSTDSMQGAFHAAATEHNLKLAPVTWQHFVDEFDPADGFFEDGMHARLVDWAKMELLRLQHRSSGNVEAEQTQIKIMRQKAELY